VLVTRIIGISVERMRQQGFHKELKNHDNLPSAYFESVDRPDEEEEEEKDGSDSMAEARDAAVPSEKLCVFIHKL